MQQAGVAADWGRRVQLEPPSCDRFKSEYPQLLTSAQQLITECEQCLDPEGAVMDYALQVKGALEQASSRC